MKIADTCSRAVFLTITTLTLFSGRSGFSSDIRVEPGRTDVRLRLPAAVEAAGQGVVWPEYRVSRSTNLVDWTPIPGRLRGIDGRSGPSLELTLDRQADSEFFRVMASPGGTAPTQLGEGGEEVFGYATRFAEELQKVGLMSLEEFGARAPQPVYLPQLTWDPTTAAYWTNFNSNPVFQLNAAELARFKANGFVVSERLGEQSFGGLYYRVFHGDLPVFVTADSVLQAWHRTYLNMLEELEEVQLATLVEQVITNMSAQLPSVWAEFGTGPLRESIIDADYFLTVARSLWNGSPATPSLEVEGQSQRVAATLADIDSLQLLEVPMFGGWRWVDFSQFQVRGHYTNSERLKRYFRMMMWCGRTDLRLVTFAPNREDDIRQLGTAIVLHQLLRQSRQSGTWSVVEQVTREFVGVTDSMTFDQLRGLLTEAGITSLSDVTDLLTVTNLQTRLLTGELGVQSITSDKLFSPLGPEELKLPRSFTFFGQKFVLDSWAFSQVVFDKVHWPSDNTLTYCGVTNIFGKVVRRKPTCLDVAFSVLGNDQAAPEIMKLIERTDGVPFRDGLPYQHNLLAVRNVVDGQAAEVWTGNIYNAWLGALRELSAPTTGSGYPESLRTRAWGMKTLNTQLASWTELRHDTVLYAKQSYTPPVICSYPYGYVEPRPEFWRAMRRLAEVAAAAISRLPATLESVRIPDRGADMWGAGFITCDLRSIKQKQIAALQNFRSTMTTLEGIAQKELDQQPLTGVEEDFLTSIMEYLGICHQGELGYTGWYPALFYQNVFWSNLGSTNDNDPFHTRQGCAMFDALVADVHTDVPDDQVCDPGAVIHQAVGTAHLMMIAVDNGPDRMVYAGPVFSHYEFEKPGMVRLTDEAWKETLTSGVKPAAPEWTRSYLAQAGWGYDDLGPRPNVAGWGVNDFGQLDVPGDLTNAVHVGGRGLTGLAVRDDSTVVAWGRNAFGETEVPVGLSNVVAVSGFVGVSMALKADGTVVAWGGGSETGACVTNVPGGLTNVVDLDGTYLYAVAVKEDGHLTAWGAFATNVPPRLSNVVQIAVEPGHGLALKADGTVAAWGTGYYGEERVPPGLSNVVGIAVGMSHSLALKADGTVFGWGGDGGGQLSIFQGVSNLVAIAAGWTHSVGLKSDGTVISSKVNSGPGGTVPLFLTNAVEITAGSHYTLALVGTERTDRPGSEVNQFNPSYGPEGFSTSVLSEVGHVYRLEYADSWESREWHGVRLAAGTGRILKLTDPFISNPERVYRVRRW